MGLLDGLEEVLKQATAAGASEADVHDAFDKVSRGAPASDIASGLAHAFNSDKPPPFDQMLSGLFSQSSPQQRAGILNQILGSLGSGGLTQILGSLGGAAAALPSGTTAVTPQQAQQISPQTVQVLAQNAAKTDPSIVDAAAGFYAEHPTLVKTLGAGALAILMSKISQGRR